MTDSVGQRIARKWLDAQETDRPIVPPYAREEIIAAMGAFADAELARERDANWISVKERLPDRPGEVLVFADDIEDAYDLAVFDGFDVPKGFDSTFRVTHWQELPASPACGS